MSTTGALTVTGNTVLGSSAGSQTLTVNAAVFFSCPVTASSTVLITGSLTASGSTVLGSRGSQKVTINSPRTEKDDINAAATII